MKKITLFVILIISSFSFLLAAKTEFYLFPNLLVKIENDSVYNNLDHLDAGYQANTNWYNPVYNSTSIYTGNYSVSLSREYDAAATVDSIKNWYLNTDYKAIVSAYKNFTYTDAEEIIKITPQIIYKNSSVEAAILNNGYIYRIKLRSVKMSRNELKQIFFGLADNIEWTTPKKMDDRYKLPATQKTKDDYVKALQSEILIMIKKSLLLNKKNVPFAEQEEARDEASVIKKQLIQYKILKDAENEIVFTPAEKKFLELSERLRDESVIKNSKKFINNVDSLYKLINDVDIIKLSRMNYSAKYINGYSFSSDINEFDTLAFPAVQQFLLKYYPVLLDTMMGLMVKKLEKREADKLNDRTGYFEDEFIDIATAEAAAAVEAAADAARNAVLDAGGFIDEEVFSETDEILPYKKTVGISVFGSNSSHYASAEFDFIDEYADEVTTEVATEVIEADQSAGFDSDPLSNIPVIGFSFQKLAEIEAKVVAGAYSNKELFELDNNLLSDTNSVLYKYFDIVGEESGTFYKMLFLKKLQNEPYFKTRNIAFIEKMDDDFKQYGNYGDYDVKQKTKQWYAVYSSDYMQKKTDEIMMMEVKFNNNAAPQINYSTITLKRPKSKFDIASRPEIKLTTAITNPYLEIKNTVFSDKESNEALINLKNNVKSNWISVTDFSKHYNKYDIVFAECIYEQTGCGDEAVYSARLGSKMIKNDTQNEEIKKLNEYVQIFSKQVSDLDSINEAQLYDFHKQQQLDLASRPFATYLDYKMYKLKLDTLYDDQKIFLEQNSGAIEDKKRFFESLLSRATFYKEYKTLLVSEMIYDDLDADGTTEAFHFALENGKLIDAEFFTQKNNSIVPYTHPNKEVQLKNTKLFTEFVQLSKRKLSDNINRFY